jgi:hypothetical protein
MARATFAAHASTEQIIGAAMCTILSEIIMIEGLFAA